MESHAAVTDVELGLDTFGDITAEPDGALRSGARTLRDLLEQGVLADEVGVDFLGVGEHHRDDYAVSAPEVVLGAIAARTTRMRLGSAVTVLSSDDPIRVFQRFSTVDALSSGRAEVILGRGSFTESFPLFGYDLADYEELFSDKLALFAELRTGRPVSWSGSTRGPLQAQTVYPELENPPLPTWIAVGGSPESVVRAASYGLPLMLAIIGGDPLRFQPYVDLYHRALREMDKSPCPSACTRRAMSPTPTPRHARSCGRTTASTSGGSAANADGPRRLASSSSGRPDRVARSTSGPPRRWRPRSPPPCGHSASAGST